jgi:hypothetical protein
LEPIFHYKADNQSPINRQYEYLGITVPSYGLRNENRLPTYHHLDIAATLTPRKTMTETGKPNGF